MYLASGFIGSGLCSSPSISSPSTVDALPDAIASRTAELLPLQYIFFCAGVAHLRTSEVKRHQGSAIMQVGRLVKRLRLRTQSKDGSSGSLDKITGYPLHRQASHPANATMKVLCSATSEWLKANLLAKASLGSFQSIAHCLRRKRDPGCKTLLQLKGASGLEYVPNWEIRASWMMLAWKHCNHYHQYCWVSIFYPSPVKKGSATQHDFPGLGGIAEP